MDREIAPGTRRRKTARRIATIVIAVAAAIFTLAATVEWLRPAMRRRDLQIARVERGPVDATLEASGTVVPAHEQVISSPVEARVLRVGRRAGDRVRAGDELLALDISATQLDVARIHDRIASKESEAAQLRLKLEETNANLRAQMEGKKLDADILRYRAEQNTKLHSEGLVARQEQLMAATAAKKSEIEMAQLSDAVIRARRTGEAQLAAVATDLRTLRNELAQSQRMLELAMTRADRDGVLTWIVPEAGATVRRGEVIARIADLSSYRVLATISELYVPRIAPGMRVRIEVDRATILGGTIASVDPRVENGVARFHVQLDGGTHPKLRSHVRVDVHVITGRRDNVLRVRRGALDAVERASVFVVRDDEIVKTPLRLGLAGAEHIEIVDGAREGDEIVISNMSDYDDVRKMKLKGLSAED